MRSLALGEIAKIIVRWPPAPGKLVLTKTGYPDYPWVITGGGYYAQCKTGDAALSVVRNFLNNGWFLGYPIR